MADRDSVWQALAQVKDPELGRPITDLDMVRRLEVDGGRVFVEILLTVQGCPLATRIERDVAAAVRTVPGVREVEVKLGVMNDEQREALVRKIRGPQPEPKSSLFDPDSRTRVIAVASGKGGVGKSTVTANLAVALAQEGHQVGLLDADIYGFSIPTMMGVSGPPRVFNRAIVPIDAHGVQVMSMGFLIERDTPVIWRGPMISGAVEQFLRDVLWADLDFLVVDLPPGTGDVPLSLAQRLPRSEMLVVTTPQEASVSVAKRAGYFAEKTNMRVLGVVENMASFVCPHCGETVEIFGAGGGERMAAELEVPLLARIPLEPAVRRASDEGTPIVVAAPESASAAAFRELAQAVARGAKREPRAVKA
ncbi:MAG: Mrp/NBP35 family ATP-binding protein [Firmicutes bacterium]|nr:Mrp/NBP35 family ATP-binding protein [Bacillota bacterium]